MALFFLCFFAVARLHTADERKGECHVLYDDENFELGIRCPDECPFRTHGEEPCRKSTCIKNQSQTQTLAGADRTRSVCAWLHNHGKLVNSSMGLMCRPCNISGCADCSIATNGDLVCNRCEKSFRRKTAGKCTHWHADALFVMCSVVLCFLVCIILWALFSIVMAEWLPVTNSSVMEKALIRRRRAKLFKDGTSSEEYVRYPMWTDISADLAGPGFVLFMNWIYFIMICSLWLLVGALIFKPSQNDMCRLLWPISNDGMERLRFGKWWVHMSTPDGSGPHVLWAGWNYFGLLFMSIVFLVRQDRLWYRLKRKHNQRNFCVEVSNVPIDMTDKKELRHHLNGWLERLNLIRADEEKKLVTLRSKPAIRYISVVYKVPEDQLHVQQSLIDEHLDKAMAEMDSVSLGLTGDNAIKQSTTPQSASTVVDGASDDPGPFWVQVLGYFLLQTPFPRRRIRVPRQEESTDTPPTIDPKTFLHALKGSGYVYVVMDTEALACAFAAGSTAKLGEHLVRVRRATLDPDMIRWEDYAPVQDRIMILRYARALLFLIGACLTWLIIFSAFFSWETELQHFHLEIKNFMDFVVGLLLPIGNEILSAVIDSQTEKIGYRDENTRSLVRIILNVLANGSAMLCEVYLVYKKFYFDEKWFYEAPWRVLTLFSRTGPNPQALKFQDQIKKLMFPAAFVVPIFVIPLLNITLKWLIGRLRVKRDQTISEREAERIFQPDEIDLVAPYSDLIVNTSLVAYTFLISPGEYHVLLWAGLALWAFLLSLSYRCSVLRWQAKSYFGGNDAHLVMAYLLSIPLSFFAAGFQRQKEWGHSGGTYAFYHITAHCVFAKYVVHSLRNRAPEPCLATTFDEMMGEDGNTCGANYLNKNPIEVLKSIHIPEERQPGFESMRFYRRDKWYLQSNKIVKFKNESVIKSELHGVLAHIRGESGIVLQEASNAVEDKARRLSAQRNWGSNGPSSSVISNSSAVDSCSVVACDAGITDQPNPEDVDCNARRVMFIL